MFFYRYQRITKTICLKSHQFSKSRSSLRKCHPASLIANVLYYYKRSVNHSSKLRFFSSRLLVLVFVRESCLQLGHAFLEISSTTFVFHSKTLILEWNCNLRELSVVYHAWRLNENPLVCRRLTFVQLIWHKLWTLNVFPTQIFIYHSWF